MVLILNGQTISLKDNQNIDYVLDIITQMNYEKKLIMSRVDYTGDLTGISADVSVPITFKLTSNDNSLYLECNASINWQGDSSLSFAKKNFSIDFYNEDRSDSYKHKFFKDVDKNDGYHMKANFIDATHARNIVVVNQIKETYKNPLPSNARGVIDGFPVVLYINGEKQGLYTFNLKQHGKTVYGLDKKDPNQLMFRATGTSPTTRFFDLSTDISETSSADWEDRFPKTYTEENKEILNRMLTWMKNVSVAQFRTDAKNYFDIDYLIDYYMYMYMIGATDSAAKNLNIVTYDGVKWYTTFYDKDMVLGIYDWKATVEQKPTVDPTHNSNLWGKLYDAFSKEIEDRYSERDFLGELKQRFIDFTNLIPQDEYDSDYAINKPPVSIYGELSPVEYVCKWIDDRKEYLSKGGNHLVKAKYPATIEDGYVELIIDGSYNIQPLSTYDADGFIGYNCTMGDTQYDFNSFVPIAKGDLFVATTGINTTRYRNYITLYNWSTIDCFKIGVHKDVFGGSGVYNNAQERNADLALFKEYLNNNPIIVYAKLAQSS